jgi:hypothetical protein
MLTLPARCITPRWNGNNISWVALRRDKPSRILPATRTRRSCVTLRDLFCRSLVMSTPVVANYCATLRKCLLETKTHVYPIVFVLLRPPVWQSILAPDGAANTFIKNVGLPIRRSRRPPQGLIHLRGPVKTDDYIFFYLMIPVIYSNLRDKSHYEI